MILYFIGILVLFLSIIEFEDLYNYVIFPAYSEDGLGDVQATTLLVAVMSAQHNFRARKIIRETWGQLTKNRSIELKFLIGGEICPYPYKDRVTPYSCDLWLINNPKDIKEYSTIGRPMLNRPCGIGFTFLIKSAIIVDKLGLDYQIFRGNSSDRARVVIIDSRYGTKLTSATFVKEPFNGIMWKSITPIVLEEGFEGEIKVIGEDLHSSNCIHRLQYIAPVYFFETIDTEGEYIEFKLGKWRSTFVGFNYTLKGINGLEVLLADRTERFRRWSLETSLIIQQIEDEQISYNDLIVLPGFIDIYDNLSYKIAEFFKWAAARDQWKYVLKTDDDVFLDLSLIEKGLQNNVELWTCLRTENPNYWGKWRDRHSKEYPPFPSGSGYILSLEAIKKLNVQPNNKIGEDVMLGYEIQNLIMPSNKTCHWACGPVRGNSPECNVPELSSHEILSLWKLYEELGYIPSEDEL